MNFINLFFNNQSWTPPSAFLFNNYTLWSNVGGKTDTNENTQARLKDLYADSYNSSTS